MSETGVANVLTVKPVRSPAMFIPLSKIHPHPQRFADIHVDLVGPLLKSVDGMSYMLTATDSFTQVAGSVSYTRYQTFVAGWICRFGSPNTLITDRGCLLLIGFVALAV